MTAQKRETERNYIGLLHEETEEQRVADILAATKHRIIDYIFGLRPRDVQPPRRHEVGPRPTAALNAGPGTTARSGSHSQKLRWARN
jgi:hypothetical protein